MTVALIAGAVLLLALGLFVLLRMPAQRWWAVPCLVGALAVLTFALASSSSDDSDGEVATSPSSSSKPSTSTTSSSTSTTSKRSTTTSSESSDASSSSTSASSAPGDDITALGIVDPESTTDGFPAELAVDGDPTTSWVSGPAAGDDGASEFAWKAEDHHLISSVRVTPTRVTGKGFTSVEIDVIAGEGETVYTETVSITGSDDIVFRPDVSGRALLLVFRGHQDPNGSGFAELHVEGI